MRVCVVGAGPAGLTYTLRLVEQSPPLEVEVFEEHNTVGLPQHCAGLVSLECLESEYGGFWKRACVNVVRGAVIHDARGAQLLIDAKNGVAAVLDRPLFEQLLADRLAKLSVRVKLGERVTGCDAQRRVLRLANGRHLRYDLLVLATGATASLNRAVGLDRPRGLLPAINVEYELPCPVDSRYVHVYLDSRIAPRFFAWAIPLSEYRVRVGLAAPTGIRARLKLLEKLDLGGLGLARARRLREYGGLIVTGGPLSKPYSSGVIALGDTAGQVKPTTGGGIAVLSKAARIAAYTTLVVGDFSAVKLRVYSELFNSIMGRDLSLMLAVRRILSKLDDKGIHALIELAKEAGVERLAVKVGHMDFQGSFIVKMPLHLTTSLVRNPLLALVLLSEVALSLLRP
ncbi:MAG: hypothetical protein DRJ43_03155 [Thermoprotei archaeon]|nr:MAG: hypothetical protein DRJ43_03155 [Thermoprotei archaeon]